MGHIVSTPAGTYRANWRDPAGRQKAKTFKTKKEARAFLAEVERSMNQGGYIDPNAGKMRFAEFTARWLAVRSVEARTAERTRSLLRTHVLPQWGDWPIARIDHLSIQEWVVKLSRTLAPATVAKCHNMMLMILRAAVRARVIAHNSAEGVRVPGGTKGSKQRAATIGKDSFFTDLLPALPLKYRAIACAAAGAGLRWGECAGLPWRAVDLDGGRLHVEQVAVETPSEIVLRPYPKTRAGARVVPMPTFLSQALRAHRALSPNDPSPNDLVFLGRFGNPLRRSSFRRRVWVPALERAGLPLTLRFHDLRHSYATWLVTEGVPINAVQRVMGHAHASTTLNRYTHAPSDYEARVMAALDGPADFSLTSDRQVGHSEEDSTTS